MLEVMAAFGLAGATSLDAYLPLLIAGLLWFFTRRRRRRAAAAP